MSGRTAGARPDTGESELRPIPAWGATTHVGGVRRHNEDAFYVSDDVCVVADGMGGDEAGDGASQLVTRLVSDVFGAHRLDVAELPRLVSSLNTTVRRTGAENGTPGMGTTLVGVAVAENGDTPSAVVFNVGDSRGYRLANGTMTQLTTDHSHVQELVEDGRITPAEALTHPLRNVITRALGADVAVEADFHVLPEEDCRLLLYSDGLSGELDDIRIGELLALHRVPPKAAMALVEAVLDGPARDNVTAMVVDVGFPTVEATDERRENDLAPVATADATAGIGVAAERLDSAAGRSCFAMPESPWAPPVPVAHPTIDIGRPPALLDAPAWGAPNPPATDRTP